MIRVYQKLLGLGARMARQVPALPRKITTGYWRLPQQKDLLLEHKWNVLVILDACRSDILAEQLPGAYTVRSMGRNTKDWIHSFAQLWRTGCFGGDLLWFTANPVVDRELASHSLCGVRSVKVWRSGWATHGRASIPSVHPDEVNSSVRQYVRRHGQPERMIIHYLQPHSPFIGSRQLALSVWSWNPDELSQAACRLDSPAKAVAEGRLTWADVRAAYADNLALVLRSALDLIGQLRGSIILTSDHGEMLGEAGRFGHEPTWFDQELSCVPWRSFKNPGFRPHPVANIDYGRYVETRETTDKLRSLGYI